MSEITELKFLRDLRENMVNTYDLGELELLITDLGIDWDQIPKRTKSLMINDLIILLGKKGELNNLVELLNEQRPSVSWAEYVAKLTQPIIRTLSNSDEGNQENIEIITSEVDSLEAENFIVNSLLQTIDVDPDDVKITKSIHFAGKLFLYLELPDVSARQISSLPASIKNALGVNKIIYLSASAGLTIILLKIIRRLRYFFAQKSVATVSIVVVGVITSAGIYINFNEPLSQVPVEQIAFVSDRSGQREIYILNVDTNIITQLTNDTHNIVPHDIINVAWSPDGETLAFTAYAYAADNKTESYIYNRCKWWISETPYQYRERFLPVMVT